MHKGLQISLEVTRVHASGSRSRGRDNADIAMVWTFENIDSTSIMTSETQLGPRLRTCTCCSVGAVCAPLMAQTSLPPQ